MLAYLSCGLWGGCTDSSSGIYIWNTTDTRSPTNSINVHVSQAYSQIASVRFNVLMFSTSCIKPALLVTHTRGWPWQFRSILNRRYSEGALLCLWLTDTRLTWIWLPINTSFTVGKITLYLVCVMALWCDLFLDLSSPCKGGEWQSLLWSCRGGELLSPQC